MPTVDRVKVLTLIETIENIYLLNKESSLDLATLELEDSIPLFLELIKIVSKDLKLIKSVRHHYAKCLLRLKREVEAEAEFSNLSKEQPPMYEAKLQLARIYARTNRANEAKIQIEEILDGWQFDAGPSVSVALASFELISRSTMRKFKTMLNTKYSDTIASIIKETMAFGYDHSYRAFSVFSGDWAYNHPEKFLDVFGFLPLPQISSLSDNNTKNSVGDLYREAGKICLRDGNPISDTYLGLAIEFYTSVEHANAFYLRRLAESYCLKKQYSEAEKILLSLLDQDSKEPFVYFWLSKSLLGLERVLEALKNIDIGIEILDANQMGYKSSFLEIKSDIHRLIGRDDYLEILNEAKTLCDSPKYELQLANKIKDLSLTTFK